MSTAKCNYVENNVGERLKAFRKSKGLNIVNMADLLGISHGALSGLENNKSKPATDTLVNLCKNTDIDIYWLLTGEKSVREESTVHGEKNDDVPFDLNLVGQIIETVEELLQEEGTNLEPAKKRQLIELLYKYFIKTGEGIDKQTTRDYLKLVA